MSKLAQLLGIFEFLANGAFSINNVDGQTQFNVNDNKKTQGTDIIGYSFLQDATPSFSSRLSSNVEGEEAYGHLPNVTSMVSFVC